MDRLAQQSCITQAVNDLKALTWPPEVTALVTSAHGELLDEDGEFIVFVNVGNSSITQRGMLPEAERRTAESIRSAVRECLKQILPIEDAIHRQT